MFPGASTRERARALERRAAQIPQEVETAMDAIHTLRQRSKIECTLLELVRAVTEVSASEIEVLATIQHLLRSGRVRLIGALRDEPLPAA